MDGIVLEDPPIVAADLLPRRGRAGGDPARLRSGALLTGLTFGG